jgi:hypothetical protein
MGGPMSAADRIDWRCDVCGGSVGDGDGWLSVLYADIHAYEQAEAAWEEAHIQPGDGLTFYSLEDLWTHPRPAPWSILHKGCDPDPHASSYWIGIERIRTPIQVIDWSSHLLGKVWLTSTTWRSVLRTALGQRRPSRSAPAPPKGGA